MLYVEIGVGFYMFYGLEIIRFGRINGSLLVKRLG